MSGANAPTISPLPASLSIDGAQRANWYLAQAHVDGNNETLIGFVVIAVITFALAKDPAISFRLLADLLGRLGPMLRHWLTIRICV
jgi:hypothetical protein